MIFTYSMNIFYKCLIGNMHCKQLHLNNFKGDFLNILDFFASSDSRFSNSFISAKYTSMEILFIQLSDDICISEKKMTLMTGFVVHKLKISKE